MNNLTMLYAEDDVDVLQDTLFLLGPYFESSYTAQDGEKALEVYNDKKPDIVLLDINLPLMNGLDVAKKIRETDLQTPIVMITAYSDKDKLLNAINIGVSAYIIKPFKIEEIKQVIEKLIKKELEKSKNSLDTEFKWNLYNEQLIYKNQEISLTKNEIILMKLLFENRQNFFTAQELAIDIFLDIQKRDDANNATQLISRFRKKIMQTLEIDTFFIENVYGAGYRLKKAMISVV